ANILLIRIKYYNPHLMVEPLVPLYKRVRMPVALESAPEAIPGRPGLRAHRAWVLPQARARQPVQVAAGQSPGRRWSELAGGFASRRRALDRLGSNPAQPVHARRPTDLAG